MIKRQQVRVWTPAGEEQEVRSITNAVEEEFGDDNVQVNFAGMGGTTIAAEIYAVNMKTESFLARFMHRHFGFVTSALKTPADLAGLDMTEF